MKHYLKKRSARPGLGISTLVSWPTLTLSVFLLTSCWEKSDAPIQTPHTPHLLSANNQSVTLPEDSSIEITLTAKSANSDPPITYQITKPPQHGTLTASSQVVTYTPNPNYFGSDSFLFKASTHEGSGAANKEEDYAIGNISITVTAVDDPPEALDANIIAIEDTPMNGIIIANDIDSNHLTFAIVSNGTKGLATISDSEKGTFSYQPHTNATGSDQFTFRANDEHSRSNIGMVRILISPVSDQPVASDDFFTTNEDTEYDSTVTGNIRLIAADADSPTLAYSIVTNGTKGTAFMINETEGTFKYRPNPNANGNDTFTFKANDGTNDSNVARIGVSITPVNDAPVATNQSLHVKRNNNRFGSLAATDVDGNPLTYSIAANGIKGTAEIIDALTGAFKFTPNTDNEGNDTFTFRVSDGYLSSIGTISVSIGSNEAPVAHDVSLFLVQDNPISGVLSATDVHDDALTYSIVSHPTKGTVVMGNASTGLFTYTPTQGSYGSDPFTFKASDGALDSNVATFTMTQDLSPGALDTRWFNQIGYYIRPIGSSDSSPSHITIQPNNEIFVLGSSTDKSTPKLFMTRYLGNGIPDMTFGQNGIITTPLGIQNTRVTATMQDGKVVIGSAHRASELNSNTRFALARYHTTGTLDTSFGSGGRTYTSIGSSWALLQTLAIQPVQGENKIIAAGEAFLRWSGQGEVIPGGIAISGFALARYNPDGTLDTAFGNNGKITTNLGVRNASINAITIQSDGTIVALGYAYQQHGTVMINGQEKPKLDYDFAACRYAQDGTLDRCTTYDFFLGDDIGSVASMQPDGKILFAGTAEIAFNQISLALMRVTQDLDLELQTVTNPGDSYVSVNAMLLQTDNKIVVAGSSSPSNKLVVVRFDSTGVLDSLFGVGGKVFVALGPLSGVSTLALQPDGKIVAAGYSANSTAEPRSIAIVRFMP